MTPIRFCLSLIAIGLLSFVTSWHNVIFMTAIFFLSLFLWALFSDPTEALHQDRLEEAKRCLPSRLS